jgi:hypothetical protein
MNMINTVNYLLNVRRMWDFSLEITEKKYNLQRQFSVFRMLMLPRGSCAALNLNISLEGKE